MIEISVKVSDAELTLTQKFLHYTNSIEPEKALEVSHEDAELSRMVNETIAKFKGQPEDVIVKLKYTW